MTKRWLWGFRIFFAGLRTWLGSGTLLRLSLIPLVLDLICLVAGMVFAASKIPALVARVVQQPHVWYQYLLYYGAVVFTALGLLFAVLFVVFVVANLLTFPFNDLLAERTLSMRGALPEKKKDLKSWIQKTSRNSGAMLKRTLIFLVIGGLVFLATLIPGLGFFGILISVFLMAWDRVDYSFDHYQWTFKQRVSFVKSHLAEIFGFAFALGLTTALPVINIFILPGSVVAGAALVADITKKERSA